MLKIIQVDINNLTNEIDKFISQNSENYRNSNGSNSTKNFKFISFFVSDKLSYFE